MTYIVDIVDIVDVLEVLVVLSVLRPAVCSKRVRFHYYQSSAMVELKEGRIWIDGCFDFSHHGHAGAMMQARQNGDELYVGVHNDHDILVNKGPPVMTLDERMAAVEGCRWCTKAIPNAPYVTDPKVMDEYGCKYVVHGDDITTDKDGNDCYAEVKAKGRFIVVKRTPNISTTDLVGRMLVDTIDHHMESIDAKAWDDLENGKNCDSNEKKVLLASSNIERYQKYATCEDAKNPGDFVWIWTGDDDKKLHQLVKGSDKFVGKKVYYVDGGFDLFHPGHITLLKKIREIGNADEDDCIVVVGLVDDHGVNSVKGKNYPIMNLLERSLCVLQSKYVDGIVLGAPNVVNKEFMDIFNESSGCDIKKVVHGPSSVVDESNYEYPKSVGAYMDVVTEKYGEMTVGSIVDRVVANRAAFEERQRRKGWKSQVEQGLLEKEKGGV